jgi:hypothetical protein
MSLPAVAAICCIRHLSSQGRRQDRVSHVQFKFSFNLKVAQNVIRRQQDSWPPWLSQIDDISWLVSQEDQACYFAA